jgi:hypothetical protein
VGQRPACGVAHELHIHAQLVTGALHGAAEHGVHLQRPAGLGSVRATTLGNRMIVVVGRTVICRRFVSLTMSASARPTLK